MKKLDFKVKKLNFSKGYKYLIKLMPYIKECGGTMNPRTWLTLVDNLESLDREFNIKIQEERRTK